MAKPQLPQSSNKQLERACALLEQLIAVEMYKGGATQPEIADSLGISVGKVNGLVKGVKIPKNNHGKQEK